MKIRENIRDLLVFTAACLEAVAVIASIVLAVGAGRAGNPFYYFVAVMLGLLLVAVLWAWALYLVKNRKPWQN